ncbi:hypothetical protein GQ43DRAFT_481526 [Delitschia confertaspora ATCC 74209]|uniref:Rhodopsin domain-containing protein n=1 Tax=Delitschia confertaspora ATCC 74209 TaxID=1513339 RepID=A0A9P4MPC7_9PLEO|nr:hypothetical protein GQ43DRAFT_481526 [Delitschia confertaspora ATCC 74209]
MVGLDLNTTPDMRAPLGQVSNLKDPYSLHNYLVATSAICLGLAVLAVIVRIFTKTYLLKEVRIEDLDGVCRVHWSDARCWGRWTWKTSMERIARGRATSCPDDSADACWRIFMLTSTYQLANILMILYPVVMFAAKLTVLLQTQRIFASHQRNYIFWSVQIMIAANFVTCLASCIAFIFACWPREKIWNPRFPGKCINTKCRHHYHFHDKRNI